MSQNRKYKMNGGDQSRSLIQYNEGPFDKRVDVNCGRWISSVLNRGSDRGQVGPGRLFAAKGHGEEAIMSHYRYAKYVIIDVRHSMSRSATPLGS